MDASTPHPGQQSSQRSPRALPGFAHINRYWDKTRQRPAAKILPGEYYVTTHAETIVTVLGSCVSACIRDPKNQIGGMNHFMLPQSRDSSGQWAGSDINLATRYGTYAMEHMINDILKHGGERENLEVKMVGGGQIIEGMSDVGSQNIAFIRHYLLTEGLTIVGQDLGDIYPRKVVYHADSGRLQVRRLRTLHNDTIFERERRYKEEIDHQDQDGEIDLF